MKRKTVLGLMLLIAASMTACGKDEEIMVQIPEVELRGEVEYENKTENLETEIIEEETTPEEVETETEIEEIIESNIEDNTLYVINTGMYFSFNDEATFSIYPLGAKEVEIKEEVSEGVTMTTTEIEGEKNITGPSDLMRALYDNAENIYIKVKCVESKENDNTYELINYECYDISTQENLGKLSPEELKSLTNKNNEIKLEEQNKLLKDMEEITETEIDISTLEPGKYYSVKNDFNPYVSTKDSYALYYFDPNEALELDDFSIFNNGIFANYSGGKTLMVKIIDSDFIKEYSDEFDIINVSDILAEGTYDSFAEDAVYNDTENTVNIKNEKGDIYTIEADQYIIIDWMYDGDLTIE